MKKKSAVAKGKLLEDYVACQIREKGIDPKAIRSHGSGNTNTEKGDIWTSMQILGQNVGIECKNQKTLAIPAWWKQTKKLESLGREPVLIFRLKQEAMEETKVIIYLDTLLELIAQQKDQILLKPEDPKLKYAMQRLKDNLREVIKYIDV